MKRAVKPSYKTFLDNAAIAELLAVESEHAEYPVSKALRRASRRAFVWPEEATEIIHAGRSLTELRAVGPYLEKLIRTWIVDPPDLPKTPPIRKNFLTLPQARRILQRDPSWLRDLKGDLQMHTFWSDGLGSTLEMAEAAMERGYEYIAITDHSKGLKIANGLDEQRLAQQGQEIGDLNESFRSRNKRLRVVRSIEVNLNPRGEVDMGQSSLRQLDVVLGSFHSSLRKKEDQTARYLAALRNQNIHILGHPRGRIYNFRLGLNAEWTRVFEVAAELDKAVEIDAYPDRQDVSLDLLRIAKAAGCRISIGTDAHHPSDLGFIELGLAAAMKAGIKRERILNFLSTEQLLDWACKHA